MNSFIPLIFGSFLNVLIHRLPRNQSIIFPSSNCPYNISVISGDDGDTDEVDLAEENVSAEDAPFVKLVNLMLTEAIKEGSTDVHIEPGRDNVNVRIRVDGAIFQGYKVTPYYDSMVCKLICHGRNRRILSYKSNRSISFY